MKAIIKNYYRLLLLILVFIVWIWSAYDAASSHNWFAENSITFILIPIIFGVCIMYIKFSQLSFTLIAILLILHAVGAHYNYGHVPFGVTLAKFLGVEGNIYDKLVHFSFGFLIFYPLREFFLRVSPAKGFWGYLLPFNGILGLAALYEIFEWVTVLNLPSETAHLFIGGTDPFDTTKDLLMAGIGSLLALLIVGTLEKLHLKEIFWKKIKHSFKRDKRSYPKEDKILHKDLI
jgi:putative membrane protein